MRRDADAALGVLGSGRSTASTQEEPAQRGLFGVFRVGESMVGVFAPWRTGCRQRLQDRSRWWIAPNDIRIG